MTLSLSVERYIWDFRGIESRATYLWGVRADRLEVVSEWSLVFRPVSYLPFGLIASLRSLSTSILLFLEAGILTFLSSSSSRIVLIIFLGITRLPLKGWMKSLISSFTLTTSGVFGSPSCFPPLLLECSSFGEVLSSFLLWWCFLRLTAAASSSGMDSFDFSRWRWWCFFLFFFSSLVF